MKKIEGFLVVLLIFFYSTVQSQSDWSLSGNSGTVDGTNFIGTTDNVPFNLRVNNQKAGRIANDGPTFFGYQAGNSNTSNGIHDSENTGFGFKALFSNTTGRYNTASGYQALFSNTGEYNTASGANALYSNTSGIFNTAIGNSSLHDNTTGNGSIGIGSNALYHNTTGLLSVAVGTDALVNSTTGNFNVATGWGALHDNDTGSGNTGSGVFALTANTTGSNNSAFGYSSGPSATNLDNTTALGYSAVPTASNSVRIGNASVTSIGGQVSWSTLSDGRFKTDIKEDVSGLSFVKQLRPVSYLLDNEAYSAHIGGAKASKFKEAGIQAQNTKQRYTGFVAQEVESTVKKTGFVFSGVSAPQNDKDAYGIRYSDFVVPLVKAVQELSQIVEKQAKEIESLKKGGTIEKLNTLSNNESNVVLYQNSPNPFTVETEIRMLIPEAVSEAKVYIYDMQGKPVATYEVKARNNSSIRIEGGTLASGLYLYALIADGKVVDVKKMILTE